MEFFPGLQACGHRFVKLYGAFKLRHMIGRCYLRGNDLQYDDADMNWQTLDQPCRWVTTPPHKMAPESKGLCVQSPR